MGRKRLLQVDMARVAENPEKDELFKVMVLASWLSGVGTWVPIGQILGGFNVQCALSAFSSVMHLTISRGLATSLRVFKGQTRNKKI